jgi:hypothetical protein
MARLQNTQPSQQFVDRTGDWALLLEQARQQKIPMRPGILNHYNEFGQPRTPAKYAREQIAKEQAVIDEFQRNYRWQYEPTTQIQPEPVNLDYFFRHVYPRMVSRGPLMPVRR